MPSVGRQSLEGQTLTLGSLTLEAAQGAQFRWRHQHPPGWPPLTTLISLVPSEFAPAKKHPRSASPTRPVALSSAGIAPGNNSSDLSSARERDVLLVTLSATASARQAAQAGSTRRNLPEFPGTLCYCRARARSCCPATCQEWLTGRSQTEPRSSSNGWLLPRRCHPCGGGRGWLLSTRGWKRKATGRRG